MDWPKKSARSNVSSRTFLTCSASDGIFFFSSCSSEMFRSKLLFSLIGEFMLLIGQHVFTLRGYTATSWFGVCLPWQSASGYGQDEFCKCRLCVHGRFLFFWKLKKKKKVFENTPMHMDEPPSLLPNTAWEIRYVPRLSRKPLPGNTILKIYRRHQRAVQQLITPDSRRGRSKIHVYKGLSKHGIVNVIVFHLEITHTSRFRCPLNRLCPSPPRENHCRLSHVAADQLQP